MTNDDNDEGPELVSGSPLPGGGSFPDLGAAMPDLGGMLTQAMEMQSQMMAAQASAAEQLVEGQSGGGAVRISVTGGLDFRGVQISPDAVDPDDIDLLQDLVLAALHDAVAKLDVLQRQSMGGIGDLLGGGGLGDIGGLLGLPTEAGELLLDGDDDEDDDEIRNGGGA